MNIPKDNHKLLRLVQGGFGAGAILLVAVALIALYAMAQIRDTNRALQLEAEKSHFASNMIFAARDRALILFRMINTGDDFERDALYRTFFDRAEVFRRSRLALLALPLTPNERALVEQERVAAAEAASAAAKALALVMDNQPRQANTLLLNYILPQQDKIIALHESLLQLREQLQRDVTLSARVRYRSATTLLFVLVPSAFAVLGGIGLFVLRRVRSIISHIEGTQSELEKALHELRFQKAALDAHAIVSTSDISGRIVYVNDHFCNATGYTRDELIGQNHRMLKSGRHDRTFYVEMWETIAAGGMWHGEVCNHTKHGQEQWLDTTILPFCDSSGTPSEYVSVRTDITRQKLLENKLAALVAERTRELQDQLRLNQELMEAIPLPVFHKTRNGIFLGINRAGEAFFRQPRQAIIGTNGFTLFTHAPEIAEDHATQDDALYTGDTPHQRYETVLHMANGEMRNTIYHKARYHNARGEIVGMVCIVIDITDRLQAEAALATMNANLVAANERIQDAQAQLVQSEKMASIGQLAAGVAHEINNPVGYVYSNLNSLDRYVRDIFAIITAYEASEGAIQDPATLRTLEHVKQTADLGYLKEDLPTLLKESKEGLERVKKIIQDLKDFSHKSAGEEAWQVADLHKGLDSTINIVWNELKYKCKMKREYGALPPVECLPSLLNQVFMNILVNAGHAIETQGAITIRSGVQDDFAWIAISDTGKGISPENLKRIFDPFFTTKPVGQGTGLGLALAYGIIQKHNGRIEVESEVGKGTTFRLWIPLHHADQARAA